METILVVDDAELNRDLLEQELADMGYKVFLAGNGQQALDVVQNERLDLVLLDIMMPGMSGIDVLRIIRRTHDADSLPIIMVTAKSESEDIVEALEMGANDYVSKPIDIPALLARVRTQLSHKRLWELKEEFLGIASHDIRSLLMKVAGFASLLLKQVPVGAVMTSEAFENAQKVHDYAHEMLRLVKTFLEFQSMRDGVLGIALARMDLNRTAVHVINENYSYAASKNIALACDLYEDLPAIDADSGRIEQVVENLVDNAIKFSPAGSTVTVRTKTVNEKITLEVSDGGPGLTEDDLRKVFGKYTKLSGKPTGGEPSYGLGLAICKLIVDLHHGQIGVYNNPCGGATFWFTLPL